MRQIEPGDVDTLLLVRQGSNVSLLEIHMACGVHQLGRSPRDCLTVGLPFTPTLRSWRGADIETPGIVHFGNAQDFDGVSAGGFSAITISICARYFTRVADRIGLPVQEDIEGKQWLPLLRRTAAIDRLVSSGRCFLHDAGTRFDGLEQEEMVVDLILAAADAEVFDDRSSYSHRAKSVRRALALMAEWAEDGISIGTICEASGASWRTLDRGFREQFGIGPKAYLNRFRLGKVRSDLLEKRADTTVADAANAWGFWHMGQFAKDYRKMFGELPSETLGDVTRRSRDGFP